MDTQKITKQYRLSQWAKVIQARQDSGQTIKDFCQVTGISKNQYFYWQRKLRDMACTEIALKEEVLDTTPDGWLQLAPAQPQRVETLKIEFLGFHISIDAETDPELLKKACRVLRSL